MYCITYILFFWGIIWLSLEAFICDISTWGTVLYATIVNFGLSTFDLWTSLTSHFSSVVNSHISSQTQILFSFFLAFCPTSTAPLITDLLDSILVILSVFLRLETQRALPATSLALSVFISPYTYIYNFHKNPGASQLQGELVIVYTVYSCSCESEMGEYLSKHLQPGVGLPWWCHMIRKKSPLGISGCCCQLYSSRKL